MFKKIFAISVVLLLGISSLSYAQMTDDAMVEYITEALSLGKSSTQIAQDLLAKGVSSTQIKRVFKDFRNGQTTAAQNALTNAQNAQNGQGIETPRQTRQTIADASIVSASDVPAVPLTVPDGIYGHDVFNNRSLSFEPNDNAATPESYILGPGDVVIIDVWGANEVSITQTVTPEGVIMISQVGPVKIGGLTMTEAKAKVKSALAKKYSSLNGLSSQMSLTLSRNRSIQVNVMGEVQVPGTYRMSSFATVFTAIYHAGGVTEIGSLRDVKISRGGSVVANADIYEYLFKGQTGCDISLRDGDVIIVPPYSILATVAGSVKRPMKYELTSGETLADAIGYAGGFAGDAYRDVVSVVRHTGAGRNVFSIDADNLPSFVMADADSVFVNHALTRFANKLEAKGAFKRPGNYQFGEDVKTVGQLVAKAGGLSEDAFTGRAQILRERDDLSIEVIAIPIKGILAGSAPDVLLKNNDVVFVANKNDIEEKGDFTISGYVTNPGDYPYADHTSVEDLILLAGGLSSGASSVRVDVSRRVVDPTSTSKTETLAHVFTFAIKDGLMVDGTPDFELMPYDVVAVRKSPGYVEQRNVLVSGEVVFPGQYTLVSSGETISQVITRAGGATSKAYLHGGVLKRRISEYERTVLEATRELAETESNDLDSLEMVKSEEEEFYTVGVEVDKALAKPGSDYDIVLREGDEIIIPEITSTVRVQGDVLYPNTVNFVSGKHVGYYINEAGGYGDRAKRSKTYVVYMNGTVSAGTNSKVEPGCEIIIPSKPERRGLTTSEALSLGSTTVSLAAVVMSLIRTLK